MEQSFGCFCVIFVGRFILYKYEKVISLCRYDAVGNRVADGVQ